MNPTCRVLKRGGNETDETGNETGDETGNETGDETGNKSEIFFIQ
jgi:hypothetical protein